MSNQLTLLGLFYQPTLVNPTSETAIGTGGNRSVLIVGPQLAPAQVQSRTYGLIIRGTITGGTTTNHTVQLRLNSGANTNQTTFTSDTLLATTGAIAVNSTTVDFIINVKMLFSPSSLEITGYYEAMVGATYVSPAALSNIPISVAGSNNVQFTVTSLFSASNAGNAFNLNEMSVAPI